jgi:hypothetical protein
MDDGAAGADVLAEVLRQFEKRAGNAAAPAAALCDETTTLAAE